MEAIHIPEPLLEFAHGQTLEAPKDGLFLFGPIEDTDGKKQIRLGIIGSETGITLGRSWLKKLQTPIEGKVDRDGAPVQWAPAWPGFETCFGVALPDKGSSEIQIDAAKIDAAIKRSNRADAVRTTVMLFAEAIRTHRQNEERQPDVWLVIVPDVVFKYGRPKVAPPPKSEQVQSHIVKLKDARRFLMEGDLFPETMKESDIYLFSNNFHNQLKAELLADKVPLQLVLESTLHDRSVLINTRRRGLQDEATVAWNFATTLYFKTDAKPWALANVRPGVCYVGLVFKNDDSPATNGEACCAAQMFLNSGDGLVFRGALGPWYSDKSREYHLSETAAAELMTSVIDGYKLKHDVAPKELFIHGRHRFNDAEWAGFMRSVPPETNLVGVRIKQQDDMRLFRPSSSTPVLRGTAVLINSRNALLWTRGYVPRLSAYQGFETPKPLTIEISQGTGDLKQVLADILGLTKINYNSCDFAAGVPVTLNFADKIGDILMASPQTIKAPPLPFRYYI